MEEENVQEIDINPLILVGRKPVAVDALVVLREQRDAKTVGSTSRPLERGF
jgi:hypothetical protein